MKEGMETSDIETHLQEFKKLIYIKYLDTVKSIKKPCEIEKKGDTSFAISHENLVKAIIEVAEDIRILKYRRGPLIGCNENGEFAPLLGKICGIITFRLSRRQIIHIFPKCLSCKEGCFFELNYVLAIVISLGFIEKTYWQIPNEIFKELLFALVSRHVNQETLGLVFDTIKECEKKIEKMKKELNGNK